MPRWSSTLVMPGSRTEIGALLLVDLVVDVLGQGRAISLANSAYHRTSSWVGPLMISGVRASSMRIESTSSTIA